MLRRMPGDCPPLLEFDEVHRRLQLGARVDVGTREIPIDHVVGSVSRTDEFDGCFRPRTERLGVILRQIRANRPNAADTPILVYQVDHAYFVVDGHKRLALAVEEGRQFIDAEVGAFASRFHVGPGTTIEDVRATEVERRFREATGLDEAVAEARFPLGTIEEYLDLAESVKAHSWDLAQDLGRLPTPAEGARHWYDTVFGPAVRFARGTGLSQLLSSCSDAELFLLIRRGYVEDMNPGWQMPDSFRTHSTNRLRAATPGRLPTALARVARRSQSKPRLLPDGDLPDDAPTDRPAASIVRRPRREAGRAGG